MGRTRPELVSGRYGLHFHHCNDGSIGSVVEGCVIFDTGNRAYVPHTSHGISMNHNVAFNCMEASFWWDFQELSHNITWDGNLSALVCLNGIDGGCRGMEMNMGDGNVAKNNVAVYCHNGDEHHLGAYVWSADSEGVWIFENNLSHSNRSGLFVWQNTSSNHTIVGHESYNDHLGVFHGAYINLYTYTNCHFYNSLVRVKATSGNSSGVRFENTIFDGANVRPFVTEIYPSPVASGADYNAFRECTFKNYKETAVRINTFPIASEITRKHISLIKCNFSGKMVDFTKESAYDSKAYIQPASGGCSVISKAGVSAIASFAPYLYGTGKGLKGEYFNGSNFDNLAFSRIDSMIMFQQWTYDKAASPTQVHHKIKGDNYSMRWTGMVEAQYSEVYKFRLAGSGGFRLWINNVQVIDSWIDRADNKDSVTSLGINLVAGQKYNIKLEHMNMGGARACQLYWECPSLGRSVHIPQSQLYSDPVTSPLFAQNQRPVANAGADITIALPVNSTSLNGSASTAGIIKSYEWSQISGPKPANILNSGSLMTDVKDLVEGTYMFRLLLTDKAGNTATDNVLVTVNPAPTTQNTPLVANAGSDIMLTLPANVIVLDASASTPTASIEIYEWSQVSGPSSAKIVNKNLSATQVTDFVEGTYLFKLQITDKKGKTATDDITVIVNPAGTTDPKPVLVANAGADLTLVHPVNTAVLDASGSSPIADIKSYEWTKVSGPGLAFITHKNNAQTQVRNLSPGVYLFKLKITDKAGNSATDDVLITVNPDSKKPSPPLANAGSDITITLPSNSVVLDGSASSPAGSIKSYEWSKVSGPSGISSGNKNSVNFKISDLVEGSYVFNLQVTNTDGLISNDEVVVTVKAQPPVANAGSDISTSFPMNSVVLNGSSSFAPTGITKYEWTKVSGPRFYRIANKNAISPVIKDMEVGTYVFQLQITDKNGATAEDVVTVNVSAGNGTTQSGQKQPMVNLNIKASPNPSPVDVNTTIKVTSNYGYPITVRIYDRWGKLVATFTNLKNNQMVTWNAQGEKGTYFANAEQGTVTKTMQIIKL